MQTLVRNSIPLNINLKLGYPNSGSQRAVITSDGFKLIEQNVHGSTLNYDGWFTANGTMIAPPSNAYPGKFLFDLNADPNEQNNLYNPTFQRVKMMEKLLDEYEKDYQVCFLFLCFILLFS